MATRYDAFVERSLTRKEGSEMIKRLYVVYDDVAHTTISGVIPEVADAPAIRAFHDALKQTDGLLGQHPADFRLIHIGDLILDEAIIVEPTHGTVTVATGAQWLEAQEKGMTLA